MAQWDIATKATTVKEQFMFKHIPFAVRQTANFRIVLEQINTNFAVLGFVLF